MSRVACASDDALYGYRQLCHRPLRKREAGTPYTEEGYP
jgi:hypothetical protein